MKRKHLRILVPILVLVLAAVVLFLQQLQKTEPVYFRTAAYGRLTGNLEGDPFTVHRWAGGDSCTPVFTEEGDVWPEATAISGDTLYCTVVTEENDSQVYRIYRADLKTGQREMLAELDSWVWELKTCGKELFLVVYDPEAGYRLGVLRSGEFLDCAPVSGSSRQISCDGSGCWYTAYESAEAGLNLCYLPADTLVPETVYTNIPLPIELQAAPEGVYLSWQFVGGVGGYSCLTLYPRDGSGEKQLLTELTPDGPEVSEKKQVSFTGFMALWEDKLFYVTYTAYANGGGADQGHWLHCLDRKTGKVTDYGRIDPDTDVGTVHFSYLLACGKQGFILTESDWWAADKETANRYSLYTWNGRRTELKLDGSGN